MRNLPHRSSERCNALSYQLVGSDIVEVNPYLHHAELTEHIAVQLLIETLASGV